MLKASFGFLKNATQLTVPTREEFFKWFTMDPDSDAILETDAEICDRVQEYLEATYTDEWSDKFFELVDKFNELGIAATKWAGRGYELLFEEAPATMKNAYLGLNVIYSEVMKEKTKKSRKTNSH